MLWMPKPPRSQRHLPCAVVVATDVPHVNTPLSEVPWAIIAQGKTPLKTWVTS